MELLANTWLTGYTFCMADEPENLVLEHLRAIRAVVEQSQTELRELKVRVGRLAVGTARALAHIQVTLAEHSVRFDGTDERLDRIEKRLGLVDAEG
jgi:hypothetical protein